MDSRKAPAPSGPWPRGALRKTCRRAPRDAGEQSSSAPPSGALPAWKKGGRLMRAARAREPRPLSMPWTGAACSDAAPARSFRRRAGVGETCEERMDSIPPELKRRPGGVVWRQQPPVGTPLRARSGAVRGRLQQVWSRCGVEKRWSWSTWRAWQPAQPPGRNSERTAAPETRQMVARARGATRGVPQAARSAQASADKSSAEPLKRQRESGS